MNPHFTINFRREAHLQEITRSRRRVVMLGAWVAYFGVLLVLFGLYGLNCASLGRRVRQVERQAARLRQIQGANGSETISAADVAQIERFALNPRRWRDRLLHLAALLPANVRVTSLIVNPQNLANELDENKLVITGVIKSAQGKERMEEVMDLVSRFHADSVFAASYQNVKLASTRVSEGPEGTAEFVIECR